MSQPDEYTQKALEHIRHLSEAIGGRGSCTPAERRAAEYMADQMRLLGVSDVRLELYKGAPSTYRPYALAFTSALVGTLLVWLVAGRGIMAVGDLLSALGAAFDWPWVRWIGLAAAVIEISALSFCLQADFTPFSPGANDDASGASVILAVAERLSQEPLIHTEVWLALTGCEEVAAYGMAAFLDAHQAELGDDAVYVILDQVGLGRLSYLTADGLIVKRKAHPRALELVQQAKAALPDLEVGGRGGIAYTDAAVATKRGLIALTLDALPPPGVEDATHWHQMSDTLDHVDPQALADAHVFTWQILKQIDQGC